MERITSVWAFFLVKKTKWLTYLMFHEFLLAQSMVCVESVFLVFLNCKLLCYCYLAKLDLNVAGDHLFLIDVLTEAWG